jgi:hypothetical protein
MNTRRSVFVDASVPPEQRPNYWHLISDPEPEPPHVNILPSVPSHRLVVSKVDVYLPGSWAPGSAGAKAGKLSPFGGAIRRGQAFDILSPVVAQHPDWFELPRRDLTAEDIERVKALERDA